MEEIFKPVPGYEDRYLVSDNGVVLSSNKLFTNSIGVVKMWPGREVKQVPKGGYRYCNLKNSFGQNRQWFTHRIVAIAFIPNPENKKEVNHKDGCVLSDFW